MTEEEKLFNEYLKAKELEKQPLTDVQKNVTINGIRHGHGTVEVFKNAFYVKEWKLFMKETKV